MTSGLSDLFGGSFGVPPGFLWGSFGVPLGLLWGSFGVALGLLWGYFGPLGLLWAPHIHGH